MSGFKNSENQLRPDFYRIVVDMAAFSAIANPAGGAITPNSADSFSTANLPTTLAKGEARARGNLRWQNIIFALSNIADCQIIDVEVTGDLTGDHQATALAFTAKYERPQGILGSVQNMLGSPFLAYDGATTVDTAIKALTDQICRAIGTTRTQVFRVYNGTSKEDFQISVQCDSPIADIPTLWSKISVSLIDGTEVISSI